MKNTESLTPQLERTISRIVRRVRLRRALHQGANGLLGGVVLAAGLLFLLHAEILPLRFGDASVLGVPLICAALAAVYGAARPVSRLEAAMLAERRLELKERFSTALLLQKSAPAALDDPFAARQVADAEKYAQLEHSQFKQVVPLFPLSTRAWASVCAALALALAWFLPIMPFLQSAGERAERAAVQKQGERLVRIAKAAERDASGKKLDAATRKAAAKLSALGREMKTGRMPRKKALMQTAKLTDELRRQQQEMASGSPSPPQKTLSEASRELDKALSAAAQEGQKTPPFDGANPKLNAPQNGGQNPASSPPSQNAMKNSQKALAQNDSPSLAEQLSKLADLAERGEPKSAAERQQLAEQLNALGNALDGTRLSKASGPLKDAADALKKNKSGAAAQNLREAARRVAESGKQNSDAQRMAQMADAVANGRSELADVQSEGDVSDAGEGQGQNDAFNKDGSLKKGHVHTAECLKPGGT